MGFFNKMFGTKTGADATAGAQEDLFSSALSLHLAGNLEQALATYRQLGAKQPDDNLAPFFAAAVMAGTGSIAEAAERLRDLSRRIAQGQETISLAVSRDLITLLDSYPLLKVPEVAEIVATLGDRLKGANFVQESAVCFEIAVSLLPERAELLHKLGDTLHDLRMFDYAESVLQKALEYAPNHWGALYTYAVLLQDLGRFDEAIAHYEQAVRLNPDHVNCRNNYGAALMMTNRLPEALEQCREAARLSPDSPWVKINLGNIHLLQQEYAPARTYFTEAIALHQGLAPAYYGLGSVEQLQGGDTAKARELYQKAIELNPAIPDIHHALGNLLAGDGNPEALASFATAEQLNPYLRNLQRDFGRACLQLGRREEGLEHLRTALRQHPDDSAAQELLTTAAAASPA
jgi:tetratricopeptide (TPR) repeat protein